MDDFNAVMAIEDGEGGAAEMQALINSGTVWLLQGSYGRAAMNAIEAGQCMLGRTAHRDYYGNRIPSRDEVEEGTKGSRQYVVDRSGEDHATEMEEIK